MTAAIMSIDRRVHEAVDAFMERVRQDLDGHLSRLASDVARLVKESEREAEGSLHTKLAAQRADLSREMELRRFADRAQLQSVTAVREGRVDTLERLLASVRRLDESMTLSGILEALARGAAAETSRVAILLVEGDLLQVWGHFGFASNVGPIDLAVNQAGALTTAVALQQTSFVPSLADGGTMAAPAFMRVPDGNTGMAVPITVGTEVVAVLYADDVDSLPEQEDAPVWTKEVELLVRHASLRLEHVTSVRTVEVLTKPA
jgi:hypothetical protein